MSRSPRIAALVTLTAGALALPMVRSTAQAPPKQRGTAANASLDVVRAALDKYKDPIVAIRDGYFSTLACIDFPNGGHEKGAMNYKAGGMGVHFLNMAMVGPKLDSLKPQVLLYEVVGDKLKLAGAEWFAPTDIAKTAPTVLGHKLEGPMEGHEPVLPAALHHWDLHVWLWKDNANGMFDPTNASIKCPTTGYGYSFSDKPPKMVMP
jgi:hypothetical protein